MNRDTAELNGNTGGSVPPNLRKSYALSGKIMLSAIVILFGVVIFMACLHIYARWYLRRERRRHLHRRSRRRTQLVFYVEHTNNPNSSAGAAARGLDSAVLRSLPVFIYTSKTHPELLECAVCLSEFEESEKGRLLPKCNHCFHIDCIDMWFNSHATCPLCRSTVEPVENRPEVVVSVAEPGSSSGLCSTCLHHENTNMDSSSSNSLGDRRKGFEMVNIEVPRRTELEAEWGPSSPQSQGFKSPASRLRSLKRILSMNKKSAAVSPSCGIGTSCGAELDIECGRDELTQLQTRVQTPR